MLSFLFIHTVNMKHPPVVVEGHHNCGPASRNVDRGGEENCKYKGRILRLCVLPLGPAPTLERSRIGIILRAIHTYIHTYIHTHPYYEYYQQL